VVFARVGARFYTEFFIFFIWVGDWYLYLGGIGVLERVSILVGMRGFRC
jgi:hypothetical protein